MGSALTEKKVVERYGVFPFNGGPMDFEQFQSAINTADVKVFENTLATAAINGDWPAVEQTLRAVTKGCPDLQLRNILLEDIDHNAIACKGWDKIQRAILADMPTHIVFRIDGNALYDVLYQQGPGPEDDHPVGFEVGLGGRGVISDARVHGEMLAAQASVRSWSVQAHGETATAYIAGLSHLYRAMCVALCDNEDRYSFNQNTAMFRICGWWIGLALNRYMADFCRHSAIEPTIPIFVSSNLGGGRMLGWHVPSGEQKIAAKPVKSEPTYADQATEIKEPLSGIAMLSRIEEAIIFKVCHQGLPPSREEQEFISERHFDGADPQPWFDLYASRQAIFAQAVEPLSPAQWAFLHNYVRERQTDRRNRRAKKDQRRDQNSSPIDHVELIRDLEDDLRRRKAAQAFGRHDRKEKHRRPRKPSVHEKGEQVFQNDIHAMVDAILSNTSGPAAKHVSSARKLIGAIFKILD